MLQQTILYADDFPLRIRIGEVRNIPLHYHSDIELVYVLAGEIRLTSGYCSYTLAAGDVFTNNGHEIHALSKTDSANVCAILQISNAFFEHYFPGLQKSSYRTNSGKVDNSRQDDLKRLLLAILLHYFRKSLHYKKLCISDVRNLIQYLNQYFNLFTVTNRMVYTLEEDNPVTIARISRIIGYIYENYSRKITLEDIAAREHLSVFYLSHLIRDYAGMSFRDFLCFARVERSEIELLDSNHKISQIAKNAGFSTTAYYRKFFQKWYGHSPEEHRAIYQSQVLSSVNPEQIADLPGSEAIRILTSFHYGLGFTDARAPINHEEIHVDVDGLAPALSLLPRQLSLVVTEEDLLVLGRECDAAAAELGADIHRDQYAVPRGAAVYGWDTIAAPIHVLRNQLTSERLRVPLRDPGEPLPLLKGRFSLLTSGGLRKPLYYAFLLLSLCRGGELISEGPYHAVVRQPGTEGEPVYYLIGFHHDAQVDRLCTSSLSLYETNSILRDFRDTLDLNLNLSIPAGSYIMMRFSLLEENTPFHHLSALGFPQQSGEEANPAAERILRKLPVRLLDTLPSRSISRIQITDVSSVNFTIEGAGLQVVVLKQA